MASITSAISQNATLSPISTEKSTETSTETSTASSSPSPTPSSTRSFPIHVILVPHDPVNDTNQITSLTIVTNSQDSLSTPLYVLVSVNILLALGCVCCSLSGLCLIRKLYKNKKEKESKALHLRNINW